MPHSDIYTQAVRVSTAHEFRRSEYQVGIGYDDDLDSAYTLLAAALPWDFAPSWVAIKVRWWTHSHKADVTQVHAQGIKTIKPTPEAAAISMPGNSTLCVLQDPFDKEEIDEAAPRARH